MATRRIVIKSTVRKTGNHATVRTTVSGGGRSKTTSKTVRLK